MTDVRRAIRTQDRQYALTLLERYSVRPGTPDETKRDALVLAEKLGEWYFTGPEAERVHRLVKRLSKWRRYGLPKTRPPEPAHVQERFQRLSAIGLAARRARILSRMQEGPYDVNFTGVAKDYDERALRKQLVEIGYSPEETHRLIQRVIHIEPERVAVMLDQTPAIEIKTQLEGAGAKVKIVRTAAS